MYDEPIGVPPESGSSVKDDAPMGAKIASRAKACSSTPRSLRTWRKVRIKRLVVPLE
jgi:hypothetical protein